MPTCILKIFHSFIGQRQDLFCLLHTILVATALVNPEDDEDLALILNGKKKKINRNDFIAAFTTLGLSLKQQENIFNKMENAKPRWFGFIETSFLNDEMKEDYKNLLQDRFIRIYLITN